MSPGNETNFFVRDTTGSNNLPFKVRKGATTNAFVVDEENGIGLGMVNADSALHLRSSDGSAQIKVEETGRAFTIGEGASATTRLALRSGGDLSLTGSVDQAADPRSSRT